VQNLTAAEALSPSTRSKDVRRLCDALMVQLNHSTDTAERHERCSGWRLRDVEAADRANALWDHLGRRSTRTRSIRGH
jgi:hypothetical protein